MTCRDPLLRSEVLKDLKTTFNANVLSYQVPQEVNEILFCWKDESLLPDINSKMNKNHPAIKAFEHVNAVVKDEVFDITEALLHVRVV